MPTWKTMTSAAALSLWNEVHQIVGHWNGSTVREATQKLKSLPNHGHRLKAQIKELRDAMEDAGRLEVTRAGVLWLKKGCADWERFAALYADQVLHDEDPLLVANQSEDGFDFMVAWPEWVAFLEGLAGHPRASTPADDAYQAGRLAHVILDDRRTYVTKIWEYLAARGRRWSSRKQIMRGIGSSIEPFTRGSSYLHFMHRESLVELRCVNTQSFYRLKRKR
jgi:hypothetical protein